MKNVIPCLFTSGNLGFGVLSMIMTLHGLYTWAGVCILLAMVCDACDGRSARALGVAGDFGKELDSLCDVVTFGAAPAFLLFQVLAPRLRWLAAGVALTFAVCGAMRLARFNTNVAIPGKGFTGMPITGAGGMLAVVCLRPKLLTPYGLLAFAGLLAFLMVSTLKYPDFKAVHLPKENGRRLILLGSLLGLAGLWSRFGSVELAIVPLLLYTASGPFYTYYSKKAEGQA